MVFSRKYATGTGADIVAPIVKAGVNDFAVAADWTPAAGDVKISKDGGAAANIATLPVFITSIGWKFVFSDAELTAARVNVNVVDSATKAVEDQHIVIETYGNASAMHAMDFDDADGTTLTEAGGTGDHLTAIDVAKISGSTATANNLETIYDGVEGFLSAYMGPRGPGVYFDDAAANTNTVNGVDGTWSNHVSTIVAVKTIADSLGVKRIYLVNNTDAVLDAAMADWEIIGIGEIMANTVDLGNQNVDNTEFRSVLISGIQGGTGRMQANGCVLSGISSMEITALECQLAVGTLTLRNDCNFVDCKSTVSGGSTPIVDVNSVASVDLYFSNYSGGVQINNAVATTVMSFNCPAGQLVIGATCTGLILHPRGVLKYTDAGTGTVLTGDAIVNRTTINEEVDTALATTTYAEPASVPAATSSLKDMVHWLFTLSRNKGTGTDTTKTLRNDADGADIANSTVSDDGTTFTRGKWS